MMTECSSTPFDQALARPFLDEPTRKKWILSKAASWFVRSTHLEPPQTEQTGSSVPDGDEEVDLEESPLLLSDALGEETSLNMDEQSHLVTFHDTDNELITSPGTHSDSPTNSQTETTAAKYNDNDFILPVEETCYETCLADRVVQMNPDLAILTERENELSHIAISMLQLNEIQKDIASAVDAQEEHVQRMSWQSIEAFEHAQSGLEHVVGTVKDREESKSKLYSFAVSAVIVLGACYIVAGLLGSDVDAANDTMPGEEQASSGTPLYLVPLLTP